MDGEFSRFDPNQTSIQSFGESPQTGTAVHSSNSKLKEKDRFSQAINVLLNYWEIKPSQYEAKLQELVLRGIPSISAFVPWAHVETDIHHSLKKFLRAAHSVKLKVKLFVMPELGVNYPNAGIPKDLLTKNSNLAVDRSWQILYNYAAPNIFALPSFSSPEVLKRFGNFLIKVGSILSEVFNEVGNDGFCEVVVTNTFFNYYRSHGTKFSDHGDYSAAHVMAFRDYLDREYKTATGQQDDGEQFKMQLYESYNRHRYFTYVEKLLREKTDMVFTRKSSMCAIRHVDLLNPECASESSYQGLLTEVLDFKPSVANYYQTIVAGGYRGEAIYLGNSGIFRRFNDQEKSFLILSSLIHSGEVSVLADEIFRLSQNFQRKLRNLLSFLEAGSFVRQNRVSYISASKFSMEENSFSILSSMAKGVISVCPGLGAHTKNLSERLVFVDPRSVIRLYELVQLFSIAQGGKIVAVPAPMQAITNYMADAAKHFDKFKKANKPLRINIGLPYEVYNYQLGQIVFYDPRAFWSATEEKTDFTLFFQALLGLAEVNSIYKVSDSRLHVSNYVSQDDPSQRLLFLINPTTEEIHVRLDFTNTVLLSALPQGSSTGGELLGKTFELAVPALGVLSMRLTDPSKTELEEGMSAAEENPSERILWT